MRCAGAIAAGAALALACTGCPGLVVRSPKNAPGRVDLAAPPAHEAGNPAAYQAAIDPGEQRSMILPGAFIGMGQGRRGGSGDVGAQLRFTFAEEYGESSARDDFPYVQSAWGATLGWSFAQFDMDSHSDRPTIAGPIFAEVSRQFFIGGVALGVAVYPTDVEVGPQITAWCWPYLFRARYMNDSGWEVFGGFQVELPSVWIWSR